MNPSSMPLRALIAALSPPWMRAAAAPLVYAMAFSLSSAAPAKAQEPAVPSTEQVAAGDLSTRFVIDEDNPEASVPSQEQALKSPLEMGYLLMDLIARAEAATQRGDHAGAVKYYRAVAKAVPDRAVSFAKLCRAYKELGQLEQAIQACRAALGKGGAQAEDHALFVRLLLRQSGQLSATHVADADAVIEHLRKEVSARSEGVHISAQLACELGTRIEDEPRLQACVEELARAAPLDPRTLTFRFALAMLRRDFGEAESVVEAARAARLPESAISNMADKLAAARAGSSLWQTLLTDWKVVALAATVLAFAFVLILARRRPRLSPA